MRARGELSADPSASGFTYIGLLIFIVLLGIGLALVGQVWHTAVTREKERDLLFIGGEFARAIGQYYARNGGLPERYPKQLEDLLEDRNQLTPQRYLRRIYRDPLSGKSDWGLIRGDKGGIMGVYSLAEGMPVKQARFPAAFAEFDGAIRYSNWKFMARQPLPVATAATGSDSTRPPAEAHPPDAPVSSAPGSMPQASVPPKARARDCGKINQSDAAACE